MDWMGLESILYIYKFRVNPHSHPVESWEELELSTMEEAPYLDKWGLCALSFMPEAADCSNISTHLHP
jgi:hypothetical protein